MQQLSTPAQIPRLLPTILESSDSGHSSGVTVLHVSGSSRNAVSPRSDRQSSCFSFKGALRNIANRLAGGARASISANHSDPERLESPRSVESRSSLGDLTQANASDISSGDLPISVDDHVGPLQQFLDQESLDLNGRPTQDTQSVGVFSTPHGKSADFGDQGSEISFARMLGAHESLASEERQDTDFEGSEGLTRSASFGSISFGTGGSPRASIEEAPADPFLSDDPAKIPRFLLPSEVKPEMFVFWRMLGKVLGLVSEADSTEKNIASFNILNDQGCSSKHIKNLQEAFQQDRQNLHLQFNGDGDVDGSMIDDAICQHIQSWLKANLNDHPLSIKQELLGHFMAEVSRSLLGKLNQESSQDGTESEVGPDDEPVVSARDAGAQQFAQLLNTEAINVLRGHGTASDQQPGSPCSPSVRDSFDGTTSTPSVNSDGWGDEVLPSSNFQRHSQLAVLLPKANPGSLFGHRNSESSRLSEVAKSFSWFTQPFLSKSRLGSKVGQSPVVDVNVINPLRVGRRSLGVQFATNTHQERVNQNAASVVQIALNPDVPTSGNNPLDAMFLAQLENSGINKHQYHKTLKHGLKESEGGFRLSSQAYGGLVRKALPILGLKKSLEQKALNRLSGHGGNNLSAMTDPSRQFSKAGDKAFLTYMANQQALWERIKPDQPPANRLFEAHENGQRVSFNLLDQLGFNQKSLNPDQLIQIGKLVMSAVGAAVVRSPLAESDIATLYRKGFGDKNVPMPMNASQFRAALGPGRSFLTSERRFGTLGSQLIDLMASLSAKQRKFISPREHQMLGNLLTLMVIRQARYQEQTALKEPPSSVAGLRDTFMKSLVDDTRRTIQPALRPHMKNDSCMKAVLDAVGHSLQKGMSEAARLGTAPDAVFLDRFKDAVLQDGNLLAIIRNGLIENLPPEAGLTGEIEPQTTPEHRQIFLGQLMGQIAEEAHCHAEAHAVKHA